MLSLVQTQSDCTALDKKAFSPPATAVLLNLTPILLAHVDFSKLLDLQSFHDRLLYHGQGTSVNVLIHLTWGFSPL